MQQTNRTYQAASYIQQAASANADAINARINPSEVLKAVERFLRGIVFVTKYEDGQEKTVPVQLGAPLANDIGQQRILLWVNLHVNSSVVMSNFTEEGKYDQFLFHVHRRFNNDIILNCRDWGIHNNDLNYLIGGVIDLVDLFLRRTIDDGERIALGNSSRQFAYTSDKPIKQQEATTTWQK